MGLIQTYNISGGGGGGGAIGGWRNQVITQTTNFTSGLTLTLTDTPVYPAALTVDYNGQRLNQGTEYSVSGNTVTILFADPDVTSYDFPPTFQCNYPIA